MRIACVEFPEGLDPESGAWQRLHTAIASAAPEITVTNEMPFGSWLCSAAEYDAGRAARAVAAHDVGITALRDLSSPIVISTRPVAAGSRLANEGFVLINGDYHRVHHKQFFPDEHGFYEAAWFTAALPGFEPHHCGPLAVGFMICTEVMFNEWARHYRRQGCHLIVVPRASEAAHRHWMTAASMAAIVSGCYVVSSNRVGPMTSDMSFGGKGFAFAPDGTLIAETSADEPVATIDLDVELVHRQQRAYPCYVREN